MVSEKVIIAIITVALILSVVSIVFTVSSLSSIKVPVKETPKYSEYTIPDSASAQVSLAILPNPNNEVKK
jgi:hypothetical protein